MSNRLIGLAVFMVFCVNACPAQEQWLKYRYSREAGSVTGVSGLRSVAVISKAPQGVRLPQLTYVNVTYAKWATPMVKAGYVWLALVQGKVNGPYDQLIMDTDCDGDLADETPIEAYRIESYSYFGPVKVVFKGIDGPVAYHLNLQYLKQDTNERLYVGVGGWYEGSVKIGEETCHCLLVDQTVNGTFDDSALSFSQADRISLGQEGTPDFRIVGRYIEHKNTLYTLDVAQDGAFIEVKPAENVPMGEITLSNPVARITVSGEMGQFDRVPNKDGSINLPVGEYLIDQWTLEAKDKDSIVWTATATCRSERSRFDVAEASTGRLCVGEPLVSNLSVNQDKTTYTFNQTLTAALGESVTLKRNGAQAPAPKVHIKDKTGTYERTLSFEYG